MLHLIGLHHTVQSRSPGSGVNEGQKAFADVLRLAIQTLTPVLIAEEDSEETLLRPPRRVSIAKQIADDSIKHRFCDPRQEQRRAIGHFTSAYIETQMSMHDQDERPKNNVVTSAQLK